MDAGTEPHTGASAGADLAATIGDAVARDGENMTIATELGAFLRQVAAIAAVMETGAGDPRGFDWGGVRIRAMELAEQRNDAALPLPAVLPRRVPPPSQPQRRRHAGRPQVSDADRAADAAALRQWMHDHDCETYTDVADWLNAQIEQETGTRGRYTCSQVGVWAAGKRAVPATVHDLFWPEGGAE